MISKLKNCIDQKLLRFILVGICNTLVGTLIMFSLYNIFHVSYWFSTAANYIVGSILSYFLNKYFTFGQAKKSLSIVIKFVLNIVVCYFIAYGVAKPIILFLLSNQPHNIQDNISMLFGLCFFTALNYFSQRYIE